MALSTILAFILPLTLLPVTLPLLSAASMASPKQRRAAASLPRGPPTIQALFTSAASSALAPSRGCRKSSFMASVLALESFSAAACSFWPREERPGP